jgi:hypothetical protein
MANDEYIVIRRQGPAGDGCVSIIVCLILFGLYVWFRSWFDDYAPHSPLFRFIAAFYHHAAAAPWRAYWGLNPTPFPRINGLLGVLGMLAVPALLFWLAYKQKSFPEKTQARLNLLWIILRFGIFIFAAPIMVGIVWLILLGIWNLLVLLVHWLLEKT